MQQKEGNKAASEKAVLIYDANCPICSGTIAWIKEHEREGSFEMLPCQSEDKKKRYPFIEEAVCMQAMQLVLPDGKVLGGEKALPEIFKRLKRYRAAAALFKLPGSDTISRIFYQWFARRRYHIANLLFGKKKDNGHRHDE